MPLRLVLRGRFFHVRGTVAGCLIRRSTGATDKKIAERIRAEIELREWRRHLDGPGAVVTMTQAFRAYEEAQKSMRFMSKLEEYWTDTPVAQVTSESIRQSAPKLYPNARPATWNRQVIAPTQAVYNHAARLAGFSEIRVRRFRVDTTVKSPASPEWVKAFAEQALEDG